MSFHGSCAAFGDDAVVLLGPPGSGKSDLLLRLLDRGFDLIGDDQLVLEAGRIRAAAPLSGLFEVRGIGIFNVACRTHAQLRLAVDLDGPVERLPQPVVHPTLRVPSITLDPHPASAAAKIVWALDAACGRKSQYRGAFATASNAA